MIRIDIEDINTLSIVPHGLFACYVFLNGRRYECDNPDERRIVDSTSTLCTTNRSDLLHRAGFKLSNGILQRKAFFDSFNLEYNKPAKPDVAELLAKAKELVKTLEEALRVDK